MLVARQELVFMVLRIVLPKWIDGSRFGSG